jgi:carboxyl-terminal processing protease
MNMITGKQRFRQGWPRWMIVNAAAAALLLSGTAELQGQEQFSLQEQARSGQFEQLLDRLRSDSGDQPPPPLQDLMQSLERYQTHKQDRQAERESTFAEALEEMQTDLENDQLEDAMIAAIDAHDVAAEPEELLERPQVRKTVSRTESRAEEAVAQENWVRALNLYQLLHLLHEKQGTYREPLDRVRQHVRVLRLYAPDILDDLQQQYREEANRDAEQDNGEAGLEQQIAFTGWEERLRGVQPTMLRQAMRFATSQHVSGKSYLDLMDGALRALEIFLETEQLSATFEKLGERQAREEFSQHVEKLKDRLDDPNAQLDHEAMAGMVDSILAKNRNTLHLPTEVLVYELASGATTRLDDFSSVIWPEELSQFSRSTQGKFHGVGIKISRREGQLTVVTPLAGTPAYRAGIQSDDVIVEVDGQDTSQWSLDRAVREITGEEGTEVTLGIERPGEQEIRHFTIERAEIEIESVRGWRHEEDGGWDYWLDKNRGIGYIRVSQFIPQTADDLDKAISRMQEKQSIQGLVLDLRFNPGGLLSAAVDVADRFVSAGPIVSTVDGRGNENTVSEASERNTYPDFPMTVLTNGSSASASEIVAGVMQDYDRGLVVGSRTFGKGSVQDLFPLVRDKAYLKLTTQYYMLPDGRIIHRKPEASEWGVEPDLRVEMTGEQATEYREARQQVDILQGGEPADKQAREEAKQQAEEDGQNRIAEPSDILEQGLDPQLASALLVLKTELVADEIAIAQGPGSQ